MHTYILDDQGTYRPASPDQILDQARQILEYRLARPDTTTFNQGLDVAESCLSLPMTLILLYVDLHAELPHQCPDRY